MQDNELLQYTPLTSTQIRLLIVQAGKKEDIIHCHIIHKDIGVPNFHPYETISYCWGDATNRSTIVLQNENEKHLTTLSVPSSTADALRCVRLLDAPRTVWLDAVCINQNDNDERARQVAMMGDIYRKGSRNLVCLGQSSIRDGLDSVEAILRDAEATEGSFTRLRSEAGAWQYSSTGMQVSYDVDALLKTYRLPWFRYETI